MDRSKSPDQGRWQDCPPQTLSGLVRKQETVDRRQALATIVSGGVTIAATTVCGIVVYRSTRPATREPLRINPAAAHVCCRTVMSFVDGYLDGTLNRCLQDKIKIHLARCGSCRDVVQTLREDSAEQPDV